MVDASFVLAPRRHNTPEENRQIKDKEGDRLWKDNPHKKCQKDTDALWTRKGGTDYFGYKNHIKSDTKSKLIISNKTTSATPRFFLDKTDLTDEQKYAIAKENAEKLYKLK